MVRDTYQGYFRGYATTFEEGEEEEWSDEEILLSPTRSAKNGKQETRKYYLQGKKKSSLN